MKYATQQLAELMARTCAIIIAVLPFHAFITVWLASIVGHYTALRLWKEVLLFGLVAAAIWLYWHDNKIRAACRREPIIGLIAAYVFLVAAMGLIALVLGGVNLKAFLYGLVLDTRFLLFFIVTWTVTQYTDLVVRLWKQLLLIPAAAVVGFGALQYLLLPADFLRHFGYGPETIAPTTTIDQKDAYRRVQSTLRGVNPLGAYLVLILSALGNSLLRRLATLKKSGGIGAGFIAKPPGAWKLVIFFVISGLVLIFTFSRSAWLGATMSFIWILWASITSGRVRRTMVGAIVAAFIAGGAIVYALRDNDHFQNIFFHTNEHSRSAESSNTGHINAIKNGVTDIAFEPWGGGTGTAGPASAYNLRSARISENYFVQIGQETGLAGLGLFAAINVLAACRLWSLRQTSRLAVVLLASLIGITVVNLFMHAWTDDTLAYIWWGLAGAAIGMGAAARQKAGRNKHEKTL